MTDDLAAKTTVVVPIWDEYVTKWLGHALDNLRGQEPTPAIIVVDNASAVEVPELPDVEVVRSPQRLTRGAARDLGLSRVHTPWVVMWDADDVMPPGTLRFLEEMMSTDPRLVAAGAAITEQPSGRRHRWPRRWITQLIPMPRLFALLHAVWSLYPTTGSTIMRTDAVRSAGGYGDADTGEDWLLGVSLAFRGRLAWSERVGRVYRMHAQSNWARHSNDVPYQLRHARLVRERIRADEGIPPWGRRSLPAIQVAQYLAIAGHTSISLLRRRVRARPAAGA